MSAPAGTTPAYRDRSLPPEQRVEDLLARMTLADKAGLLFHDMQLIGSGGTLMEPRTRSAGRRRWTPCGVCG